MLLQHTSGLFNFTGEYYDDGTIAPGTAWNYSNTNYVLARLLIEEVTGPLGRRRTVDITRQNPSWISSAGDMISTTGTLMYSTADGSTTLAASATYVDAAAQSMAGAFQQAVQGLVQEVFCGGRDRSELSAGPSAR
jgi:D-alanyl-D-alanine carboxypeptidase